MITRLVSLLLVVFVLAGVGLAKDKKGKLNPQTFIDNADALYYYPQTQGVTDLAVNVTIDQFSRDAIISNAAITLCFAGGDRRGTIISNIPEAQARVRGVIMGMVDPLGEFVVPKTSVETFAGMQVAVRKVYRQLSNQPETAFYELTGTPTEESSPLKTYRVLVDDRGLAYQVETEMKDGGTVNARIENTQMGDHWVISKMSTRLVAKSGPYWEIATLTYGLVDGFTLPQTLTIVHRNTYNQPIKEMPDLTYRFTNYRINKGVAAALLGKETPAPAPAQ